MEAKLIHDILETETGVLNVSVISLMLVYVIFIFYSSLIFFIDFVICTHSFYPPVWLWKGESCGAGRHCEAYGGNRY